MTYASDRVKGSYRGVHIERRDGKVYLWIEIEVLGDLKPEVLVFDPAAFEDFKYVVSERLEKQDLWSAKLARERDAAWHRQHRERKAG